jgi:NAD(P)H-dependent flavin oxidoreductase YrpB (nitropropane dioxygenase family)
MGGQMKTRVAELVGAELAIFAFSHCRDVVAAVSKAGGVGVLGTTRQDLEQLEYDLRWLDQELRDLPYGVDVLFPVKDEGDDERELRARIPARHRQFVEELAARYGVPPPKVPGAHSPFGDNLVYTHRRAREKLEVLFGHAPRLFASALGPAPADVVKRIQERSGLVVGMVGKPGQGKRHVDAGADVIVAQGTEAAGHTGDISTFVLVPMAVDEVAPVPVLAAGGVGDGRQIAAALALGAEGVWTGSIWLTTIESDIDEVVRTKLLKARATDTVISRSFSGKPSRQLWTEWISAWESEDAPPPLSSPLQGLLVRDVMVGIFEGRVERLMGTPIGQVVGFMKETKTVREVVYDLVNEYVSAMERLGALSGERE